MSIEQVIALATLIITTMSGVVAAVWKRGNDSERRLTEVYEARVKDKDVEIGRWAALVAELRQESTADRAVQEKQAETFNQLRESVLAVLPQGLRGRR